MWKVYIPRSLRAMIVIEECSCVNAFKRTYFQYVKKKTTWSDEASFKLRGTMNRHKWVNWYPQIPQLYV